MGRANTFTLEWFRQLDMIYFTGSVTLTSVFMPPYSLLNVAGINTTLFQSNKRKQTQA
jgi:hypothetical protein